MFLNTYVKFTAYNYRIYRANVYSIHILIQTYSTYVLSNIIMATFHIAKGI